MHPTWLDRAVRHLAPLLALGLIAVGCKEDSPPAYTRLSGPAPSLGQRTIDSATLVAVWATWCEPCREETRSLRRLAEATPPVVEVVVVGQDKNIDDVNRFLGGPPPAEWHFRLDEGGRLLEAFRAEKLPAAFLVVDGRLVAGFRGVRDWTSRGMRDLMKRLILESRRGVP